MVSQTHPPAAAGNQGAITTAATSVPRDLRTAVQAPLGLGGAALGNLFTAISDDAAHAVLTQALAEGCRVFDTAPHYGNGLSEQRFGRALQGQSRNALAVSTKVGRLLTPHPLAALDQNGYRRGLPNHQHFDYSAQGVRQSVQDSLRRLQLGRLDAVYVHDCDAITHGTGYSAVLSQVIKEALPEMRSLQQEGVVREVGLGVNEVQVCLDVLAHAELDCLLLAGRYSLLDHHLALAKLLPLCQARGIRVTLGGVFNSGILVTGTKGSARQPLPRFNYEAATPAWLARVAALEQVCDEFAVPLRAAALQFAMAHRAAAVVLSGAQTVDQWQDNLAMAAHPIEANFWQTLKTRGLIAADAPCPADSASP